MLLANVVQISQLFKLRIKGPFKCFKTNRFGEYFYPTSLRSIHCYSMKKRSPFAIYIGNKTLNRCWKSGDFVHAFKLFDEMPQRDTVTWNTMISGCTNIGEFKLALSFFIEMRKNGYLVDESTFGSVLKTVAAAFWIDFGRQLHSIVIKTACEDNVFVGSALLDMYAKCNKIDDACKIFYCLPHRNTVTWNAMVGGYAVTRNRMDAFQLLLSMERYGERPDEATFASALSLLGDFEFYSLTSQIHGKIIKNGLLFETIACNALITAYSQCQSIEDSIRIFHEMRHVRDRVSWNSILAAYAFHGYSNHAIEIFIEMKNIEMRPDVYTYTSALSICFGEEEKKQGMALHGLVIKEGIEKSIPVSNSLIAMYLKSNSKHVGDAIKQFYLMEIKDRFSWNTIITGFSQLGLSEEALKFLRDMRLVNLEVDQYSFSAVLRSCADLATLQVGRQVHGLVYKLGFQRNDFVASSLILMYSKCGIVIEAEKSFDETEQDNSVTWNSIIFGYAQDGQGKMALELFSLMQERGVSPDHITFVGVLSACSHMGFIKEGLDTLKCMKDIYGIKPRVEHYACVVDLLGRAGYLKEAKEMILSMSIEPDAMVWKSLLGACRIHGNIQLAEYAAKFLIVLDPKEHSTYLILSDLYASFRMWEERSAIKRVMRSKGLKKVPGWSWTEVENKVHAFNAEDRSHPRSKEIYEKLEELMEEISTFIHIDDEEIGIYDLL